MEKFYDVYGEKSLTERQCQNWVAHFRSGDFHLKDEPRSSRPTEADDDKIKAVIENNRRSTTREIAEKHNISHTTVGKNQGDFCYKMKNLYLSKSISSPSMHSCQRFFQSSKHLLNSISEIAFKVFFDSTCISSIVSKQCPRSGLLSLGNSQKSHRAKSGEYGGCGSIYVEFLAKWPRRMSAV